MFLYLKNVLTSYITAQTAIIGSHSGHFPIYLPPTTADSALYTVNGQCININAVTRQHKECRRTARRRLVVMTTGSATTAISVWTADTDYSNVDFDEIPAKLPHQFVRICSNNQCSDKCVHEF